MSGTLLLTAATTCALMMTGQDDSGRVVMQTIAHALDTPGLALAPMTPALRAGRWSRLAVRPDTGGTQDGEASALEVAEIVREDPHAGLVVLRVPGLPACGVDEAGASADGLEEGARLVGLRPRDGYRPRVYPASLQRRVGVPGHPDLLIVRIPDGGGAEGGFLLDERMRLVATILPSPPGGDPGLASALPLDPGRMADQAGTSEAPPLRGESIGASRAQEDGTLDLLARALMLTRDDQALEAIGLLDRVARETGLFCDLALERGQRNFRIGRTEAAIRDFTAAAAADPARPLAVFNLGVALGSDGRYEEAAVAFHRALRLRPDHPRTLFHLALALRAAGSTDLARGELNRLSGLDPAMAAELKPLLGF